MRKSITLLVALAAMSLSANAAYLWPERKPFDDSADAPPVSLKPLTELYRANEFSVDLFGAASVTAEAARSWYGIKDGHVAGGGFGLNYFVSRNIGVGVEARHSFAEGEDLLNRVSVNLQVRLPIGRFAPYGIVSAGYRKQDGTYDGRFGAGGGVEFRLSPRVGLFTDAQAATYKFNKIDGYLGRAGVRLSF